MLISKENRKRNGQFRDRERRKKKKKKQNINETVQLYDNKTRKNVSVIKQLIETICIDFFFLLCLICYIFICDTTMGRSI